MIGAIAVLFLLVFPTLQAESIPVFSQQKVITTYPYGEILDSPPHVKLRVFLCQVDGSIEDTLIELTREQKNDLFEQLGELDTHHLSVEDIFKEKMRLLQEFGIISDRMTIGSLFPQTETKDDPLINLTIVQNENFSAVSAPIFFTGVGIGVGMGFRRMPIIRRFAGNIGFVGLLIVGGLLCYNWLEHTLHINYGFIYPMYFGFLSGFVGIMMLAVDSLFPPPGGPPITLYSNFLALGWTGYTSWIDLTSLIP